MKIFIIYSINISNVYTDESFQDPFKHKHRSGPGNLYGMVFLFLFAACGLLPLNVGVWKPEPPPRVQVLCGLGDSCTPEGFRPSLTGHLCWCSMGALTSKTVVSPCAPHRNNNTRGAHISYYVLGLAWMCGPFQIIFAILKWVSSTDYILQIGPRNLIFILRG